MWELFLEQFDELLVKILLLAAVISFVSILCGTSVMVAERGLGVGDRLIRSRVDSRLGYGCVTAPG